MTQKTNLCRFSLFAFFVVLSVAAHAVVYPDADVSNVFASQIRTNADFDFKFNRLALNVGEELRFSMLPDPAFNLSQTTVGLNVSILKGYLSSHAGYALRLRGNKLGSTSNVNKLFRHRVYFGLTEHLKLGLRKRFVLSLRERAVLNIRTDEPNEFEKQAFAWDMRYRLQLQYRAESLPLTPYLWTEIDHTCNITDYQKYYAGGRNYLSASRTALGLKWRLNSSNMLNFYLRYDLTRDIDVDANKLGTVIKTASDVWEHNVMLGVAYNFGWKM